VQLHSSAYQRPSQLPAGDVLVVGAGNSGADIALELSGSRTTWLSGRHPGSEPVRPGSLGDRVLTPAVWFAASRLLTVQTWAGRGLRSKLSSGGHPLARVKSRDLAAAGVRRLPRTVGARSGAPVVEDHRAVDVASVIWATGYRPNFGWIDLPVFGSDRQPLHDRGVVHSEPGLYFVGLPFLFTLTSSLVGGVGRDAEHIADRIAERIAGHLGARVARRRTSRAAAASTPPTPLPGPRRFRRALEAQGRRS
jgi:putative flavoprotein involved in K+ transport